MAGNKLRILPYRGVRDYQYYLDGLKVNGKRKRLFFRSMKDARAELDRLQIKVRREGQAGLDLPDSVRVQAAESSKLLAKYPGRSILDAVRFYIAHLEALNSSVALEALITEYLQSKERAGLSSDHLSDVVGRLRRFCSSFGDRMIRTITPRELEDWLHALRLSGQSVNNFRAVIRAMFSYAVQRDYLERNLLDAVPRVKLVRRAPAIFSPEELTKLLEAAPKELLAPLAIGAFGGLRTAELMRLNWQEVRLERGYIEVTARKAKTAQRRLVKIEPCLSAWLSLCRPALQEGSVYGEPDRFYHKEVAKLCQSIGLKWKPNGLRHSFASYHLAKSKDAPRLALEMGHINAQMIFNHYREVVTPGEAERYWQIFPAQPGPNVIYLEAAR